MRKISATLAMTVLITGLACSRALASTITYVTPPGATTSGGPVNASATFTTGTDTLTILLQDLLSNPTNVAQLPSDLFFTLSGGLTVGSVSSSSATEIVINADGTSTLGSTVPVGWVLSSTGGVFHLDDLAGLGHAGPAHLIIGPPGAGGLYSNANNSIAGNGRESRVTQTTPTTRHVPHLTPPAILKSHLHVRRRPQAAKSSRFSAMSIGGNGGETKGIHRGTIEAA
jgi:hypothetical protein